MTTIFVTGHRGYIGVELIKCLLQNGYRVAGCDCRLFEGCEWIPHPKPHLDLNLDLREIEPRHLKGCSAVIHLGALSNDPMGALDPAITRSINLEGSIRLARSAKEAGVPRFLFAGSCSVYGQGASLDLDETAPLNPLTAYAESKIEAEKAILKMASDTFCPVSLRNATAYGSSAMLRLDLVVNNLLACAYTQGKISVKSDGSSWRPLIHCRDIARAFLAFLEAPAKVVSAQAVNIGAHQENYQVKEVAHLVKELIPGSEIVFTGEVGRDPRSYRVNFSKLEALLPNFKLQYTLKKGMEELLADFSLYGMSHDDFTGGKYMRVQQLKERSFAPA